MQPPFRPHAHPGVLIPFQCPIVGSPPGAPARSLPRLLDRVRVAVQTRHYSPRTEKAYVGWIRRFIIFHGKRHPDTLAEAEKRSWRGTL